MKNLSTMSSTQLDNIKFILTDIDDTLTTEGRLKSDAYEAMERLSNKGYKVIPVTGRCAKCEHLNICGGNTRTRAFAQSGDAWAEDPGCYLDDNEIGLTQVANNIIHSEVNIPVVEV